MLTHFKGIWLDNLQSNLQSPYLLFCLLTPVGTMCPLASDEELAYKIETGMSFLQSLYLLFFVCYLDIIYNVYLEEITTEASVAKDQ